jgi:uncharacterized protein (DUF58 family)
LPLLPRGYIFLVASLLMIILGIIRRDLPSLLWGSSFVAFLTYTIIGCAVIRAALRRRITSESLDLSLPSRGVFAGDRMTGDFKIGLRLVRIPGFLYILRSILRWKTRRPIHLSYRLEPNQSEGTIQLRPAERGIYRAERVSLCFQDLFGFTEGSLSLGIEETLTVFPEFRYSEPSQTRTEGGHKTPHRKRRRAREDLIEVRKYFPGDDVRKINWKVFAHTQELLIREGDDTPPPASNLLFVLDTAPSPLLPSAITTLYLDRLVEAATSAMLNFLLRTSYLTLSLTGGQKTLSFTNERKTNLLSRMASVWWSEADELPPLPKVRDTHLIIFTTPGSSSLPSLLRMARERGWRYSLLFKKLERIDSTQRKWGLSWKDLLFQTTWRPKDHQSPISNALKAFGQALAGEITHYRHPPWNIEDVRAV